MKDAIMRFVGDYKSFSNFFILKNPVRFEEMDYWTVENAYVAGKTTNPSIRYRISQMSPWQAKWFGKKILEENISANPEWNDGFRLWRKETLGMTTSLEFAFAVNVRKTKSVRRSNITISELSLWMSETNLNRRGETLFFNFLNRGIYFLKSIF